MIIQQLVLISVWLYSKLSYTQANFIVWYHQLIWTMYKIKCSKNIHNKNSKPKLILGCEKFESLCSAGAVAIKKELWL